MWDRVLRWPILVFVSLALAIDFLLYLLLRAIIVTYEYLFTRTIRRSRRSLLDRLEHATSLEKWREAAQACDRAEGNNSWRHEPASPYYNCDLIQQLTRQMGLLMAEGDMERLEALLGEQVLRSDVGGIDNALLYSQTYYRTKDTIEEYVEAVEKSLQMVNESVVKTGRCQQRVALGEMATKSFGTTALCLSGGAMLGFYHLGVVKVLVEEGLLPTVISGTSAGAALAAWLCTRTNKQLREELSDSHHLANIFSFTDDGWTVRLWRLFKHGHMLDVEESMRRSKRLCNGSITFLEAYRLTGRILNITVNSATLHAPPRLLNFQTAPNVMIFSAVLASSSIPGLLPAVQLRSKGPGGVSRVSSPRDLLSSQVSLPDTAAADTSNPDYVVFDELGSHWRDGSISIDIPTDLLRPLFNVHYTIVSQVNPGVVYFFYHARGAVGEPHGHRQGKGWRGGFVGSFCEIFLKLDMKRYLELLAGMDLLPKFLRLDWSLLALQRRDGTVTILPRAPTPFSLLGKLLALPTPASIRQYIRAGELATWPAVHMINNRMRIEHSIKSLLED